MATKTPPRGPKSGGADDKKKKPGTAQGKATDEAPKKPKLVSKAARPKAPPGSMPKGPPPARKAVDEVAAAKKRGALEVIPEFDGKWTPALEDEAIQYMLEYFEMEGEDDPPTVSLHKTMTKEALAEFVLGKRSLGDVFGLTLQEAYSIAKFGHNYLEQGHYEEAETIFKGLITLVPKDAYFHTCLGATLQRQGKNDDAIKEYTASIMLEPEDKDARLNRGELYLMHGMLAEALEDFHVLLASGRPAGAADPRVSRAEALSAAVALTLEEKLGVAARAAPKK